MEVPARVTSDRSIGARRRPTTPPTSCKRVTARLIAGEGDLLPGERAAGRRHVPDRHRRLREAGHRPGDPDLRSRDLHRLRQVRHRLPPRHHPHEGLRARARSRARPTTFKSKPFRSKDIQGYRLTIQVAPDDCTGCGVCVDVCPAKSKTEVRHKAINMEPVLEHRDRERVNWEFFQSIPPLDRDLLGHDSVKGSQVLEPLFEFSGACAGCGETPYIKLVTQLFGDRMVVANATGCSSIYGGNLPTTPYTSNARGSRAGVEQLAVRGQRRVRPGDAPRARGADRAGSAALGQAGTRGRR